MAKVGEHGTITVSDGKTLQHEVEFVEGMKIDRGFISPYFVTNTKNQKCELDNTYILITDKKITNVQSILHYLEFAMKENKPIVLLCEDVESEALAALVLNKLRGGLKICAVKAPAFGDNRKAILNDIAVLTGGTVVSEDIGMTLDKAEPGNVISIFVQYCIFLNNTLESMVVLSLQCRFTILVISCWTYESILINSISCQTYNSIFFNSLKKFSSI